MKKLTEDWITFADKDLQAAEVIIKEDFPLTNIVVFLCQKTIEKYLKAFLVENDIPIIKTHDLVKLNGIVLKIKDLGIDRDKLDIINVIYVESRYPSELGLMPDGMPANKQAKEFIEFAKEIKTIINNELS